ncbi:MAG: phosphonate C-P lyase system protein PhnG [Lentilitoribacter sp.]
MKLSLERKKWMSLLAKAPSELLTTTFLDVLERYGLTPDYTWLRKPEIGGVMVQARAGATGAPFNFGEMTVTRCSLKLDNGHVGHAYVQGRDKDKAEKAAIIDAYMQGEQAHIFASNILAPIENALLSARTTREQKAAKTKVDFFTLVRGED